VWCVQMASLSLVVTSEIKYTDQHVTMKKENKISDFLSFLFDNKKTTMLQEGTISWKKYIHIKQYFNQH